METKELKQYLKDAYELESQLYNLYYLKLDFEDRLEEFQAEKEQELNGKETYLGYDENYILKLPSYEVQKCETLAQYVDYISKYPAFLITELLPTKWLNDAHFSKIANMREQKRTEFHNDDAKKSNIFKIACVICVILSLFVTFTFNVITGIIFAVITFGALFFFNSKKPKSFYEQTEASQELANTVKQYYEDEEKAKYNWNNERCLYIVDQYQNKILPTINETEKAMELFYSKDIIHPKYRNMVAVAQIYEYLDTGRCTELEGPNGAYNLFEKELKEKKIIDKLDIIIDQLAVLNETMSYISNSLDRANSLTQNIVWSLNSIETNTAITASNTALIAYNTQCTSFNSELLRRYS